MCSEGRPDEGHDGRRVGSGALTDAYLVRRDLARGYTVVVWRGRHVADPTELEADEASGYWQEVLAVARALGIHFQPAKLNYLTLGNAVPHLHTHVVPRYLDDPTPGAPPWFMSGTAPRVGAPDIPPDVYDPDVDALRRLLASTLAGASA